MLISKKDLLAITGISYGQLYRWKRERLIPEEWFMKQSSYTGQETFFPREQILSRIRSILELKDQYSLEELAKILSPEVAVSYYQAKELEEITEISENLLVYVKETFTKEQFDYADLLLLVACSKLEEVVSFSEAQREGVLRNLINRDRNFSMNGTVLLLMKFESEYLIMMVKEQMPYMVDERMSVVARVNLNEISNQMKLKYQSRFYSK